MPNDLSAAQRYPQLFGSTFTFPLLWRELAGRAPTISRPSIKAYDSLGKSHELTYYFAKVTPDPERSGQHEEREHLEVFTSVDGGYPFGVGDRWSDRDPSVI